MLAHERTEDDRGNLQGRQVGFREILEQQRRRSRDGGRGLRVTTPRPDPRGLGQDLRPSLHLQSLHKLQDQHPTRSKPTNMIRPIPQGSRSKKKCSHKNSHISLRYSQNLFIGDNAKASVHQDSQLPSITLSPLADCAWRVALQR